MSDLVKTPYCWFSNAKVQILVPLKVKDVTFDLLSSICSSYEPRHEKTGFLPMRKQRRRSALQ